MHADDKKRSPRKARKARKKSVSREFLSADCRKHPPLLAPGGLIPAYIRSRRFSLHAKMTVLN